MIEGAVVELDPKEDVGIIRELERMEKLALVGAKDPFVVKNAMRIVIEAGIPRKAYLQEVEALLKYAQGRHPTLGGLYYVRNPIETMTSPAMVERHGAGDATDLSVWLAAHLLAIGNGPVRFVVASTAERPDDFVHVYVQYGNPESDRIRWFSLDPTMEKPMGWEYPNPGKKAYYEVGRDEDDE